MLLFDLFNLNQSIAAPDFHMFGSPRIAPQCVAIAGGLANFCKVATSARSFSDSYRTRRRPLSLNMRPRLPIGGAGWCANEYSWLESYQRMGSPTGRS